MKVNRKELQKALVQILVLTKGGHNFYLKGGDGQLSVFANGCVPVQAKVQATEGSELECLVKADDLKRIVSAKTDEDITVTQSGDKLELRDSGGKVSIMTVSQEGEVLALPEKDVSGEYTSCTLQEYVKVCEHARAKHTSLHQFLTAFYVEMDAEGGTGVLASDGKRIASRGKVDHPVITMSVPGDALYAFCIGGRSDITVSPAADGGGAYFQSQNMRAYIPFCDEKFPANLVKAREMSGTVTCQAFLEKLKACITQSLAVSQRVVLSFSGENLKISSHGCNFGFIGNYDGTLGIQADYGNTGEKELEICLDGKALDDALTSLAETEACDIYLSGEKQPIVFCSDLTGAEIICPVIRS